MKLTNNGSIVVLDDTYAEIEGLLATLSKYNLPYQYFSGEMETLPDTPRKGIRFLFLDIEMADTIGQNVKTKVAALMGRIKKIMAEDNGPYILFLWTKHTEDIPSLKEALDASKNEPILYLDMNKSELVGKSSTDLIKLLNSKIIGFASKYEAFSILTDWESTINNTSGMFINKLTSYYMTKKTWEDDTYKLLYNLYSVNCGNDSGLHKNDKFIIALQTINESYFSELNSEMGKIKLPHSYDFKNGNKQSIQESTATKLYNSLVSHILSNRSLTNGHLSLFEDNDIKKSLIKAFFKESDRPTVMELCVLDITALCDILNNKLLTHPDLGPFRRYLFGMVHDKVSNQKNGDSIYSIGPIWIDEKRKSKKISFHFGTVCFMSENKLNPDNYIFTLKYNILSDLQSRLANFLNRTGKIEFKEFTIDKG